VTNYDTVDEARLDINAIATVAMEYSPPPSNPSGTPYIKFFVFADLDSDGVQELVNSADLDGGGQKFAPALCIICHGGNRPAFDGTGPYPNEGNVGAQFIGFDLESYKHSDFEFPPFSGIKPFGRAPDASGLVSLPLPSGTQNSGFVPTGWLSPSDKSGVYNNAVKRYCRACHTTRDATLDWATFDLMNSYNGFIKTVVCNLRVMPQARRTYLNFWLSTSPHGPSVFANGGITGWSPTDACPEEP
jgi:hypothetical protein